MKVDNLCDLKWAVQKNRKRRFEDIKVDGQADGQENKRYGRDFNSAQKGCRGDFNSAHFDFFLFNNVYNQITCHFLQLGPFLILKIENVPN